MQKVWYTNKSIWEFHFYLCSWKLGFVRWGDSDFGGIERGWAVHIGPFAFGRHRAAE